MKEASQKIPYIILFCVYKTSKIGKKRDRKSTSGYLRLGEKCGKWLLVYIEFYFEGDENILKLKYM